MILDIDDAPLANVPVSSGSWGILSPYDIGYGTHVLKVSQVGVSGIAESTFTVTSHGAPVSIYSPSNNETVTTARPAIKGQGQPYASVRVTTGNTKLGETTVDKNGLWSISPSSDLPKGSNSITATQTRIVVPTGRDTTTASRTFNVNVTPPATAPVTITSPKSGATVTTARPTVTGTADPNGGKVTLSRGGTQLAPAVSVDGAGNWWATPTEDLPEGSVTVKAVQSGTGKETSVTFTVATAPVTITSPKSGATVTTARPTVTGTADPNGGKVTLSRGGTQLAPAVSVDGAGNWWATPTEDLPEGSVTVKAVQSGTGKETSVTFTVNTTPSPTAPVRISTPYNGTVLHTHQTLFAGAGEPQAEVYLTALDAQDKQVFLGRADVNASGLWSLAPPLQHDLPDGVVRITATQLPEGAGNSNITTDEITVTVRVAAPVTISRPSANTTVQEARPEIAGTGEPNATITLKNGETKIGETQVKSDKTWSITPDTDLPNGEVTVTANQDANGVTSTASRTFTVDAQDEVAPLVVEKPSEGGVVIAPTGDVEFSGTGETGARVVIRGQGGGREVVNTTVKNGKWSATGHNLNPSMHYTLETVYTVPGQEPVTGTISFTTIPVEGVEQDFTIDTPAEGSAVVAPAGDVDFAGKGTTGGEVIIRGQNGGRTIGTANVDALGNWAFTGHNLNPSMHYTLETVYTVPGQEPVTGTISFTTIPVEGVEQDFTIDTPAEGSAVVAPAGDVDFAGKGTTGGEVIIRGQNGGRTIGTANVDALGNWAFTGHNLNPSMHYTLETVYTVPGQEPVTGTISFTTIPVEGVEQDFTIDTPAEGSAVVAPAGDVDFAGKGTTGGEVIIRGQNGGRTIGTANVDALGNWAFTGHNLNPSMHYTLETVYTVPGQEPVTGTISFTTIPSK
ncbi:Ig-like domain-containing protein [Curtobacterium sp. MCLR17_054]|uniref:Ig-like domain-containing protein n=1 Tax=Curtobacterium sp. MCLR17_054 TaxID=2175632 RepID=UPI0024DFEE00|nr:Ig-like domain-containing protein [Curtobacterium sp. MCLR17_054]WIE70230.1 Ig-like domain-containing protein [Curtobacterium sp. MCLR17_054]